jgi:hypothetical protein
VRSESRLARIFESMGYFPAGLGFVLIDVRYSGMDIFPDFVGYLCMVVGLSRLPLGDPAFRTAKALAWVLVFASIPGTVLWAPFDPGGPEEQQEGAAEPIRVRSLSKAMPLAGLAAGSKLLGLAMGWCLLSGVAGEAEALGRPGLAQAARAGRGPLSAAFLAAAAYLIYWYTMHWLVRMEPPRAVQAAASSFTIVLSIYVAWRTVQLLRRAARELSVGDMDEED